jgi:poly-gamma-glutamate synthesis protein (capsule biosynthesis protein)
MDTVPAPTYPEGKTVINIVAGGDIQVTDTVVSAGVQGGRYDYTQLLMDIAPIFAQADAAIVNFEGNLVGAPYGSATGSAPAELMTALKNAGVDMVQTANSYAVYNGMDGLQLTLQGIHSAGMTPLGTFADTAEFQESGGFFIRQIQGIRVAFVAFTKGMDGMGLPAGNEDCVNLLYKDFSSTYQDVDKDGITSLLNAVDRYKPDVTIALLHWGSEYNDQTSKSQDKIVKIMKDAGVDAIIGTHPHYVQKVTYNAETGMLVAYSLGDLLGDASRAGSDYSVILDLEITKNGATGEVKITGFDYTPIYIVNDTDSGGSIRVMRIREAMAAYEADSIGAVSKETYEAMKSALNRIESRINGK